MHTQGTHNRKSVVSGDVEWVLCAHTQGTHIGGESVVCGGVHWVLCAHTKSV